MYALGLPPHPHLLQKPSLTANLGEGSHMFSQSAFPLPRQLVSHALVMAS